MYIFSDIDTQVSKLKQRGILFQDEPSCKEFLLNNNYYNVVNAYKKYILKGGNNDEYKEGVYFEDLIKLYKYDAMIRILFLKYILKIENELRSHLAYEFSKAYGPCDYLNKSVYRKGMENDKEKADSLILYLENLIKKSYKNVETIQHFVDCGETDRLNVPIWALVNLLDYGTLRSIYKEINSNLSTYISQTYYGIPFRTLMSMLSSLNVIRNMAAHNNCILKYKIKKVDYQISDTPIHKRLNIEKDNRGKFLRGKQDLFSILICFKCLLDDESFQKFYLSFEKITQAFNDALLDSPINSEDVLIDMGLNSKSNKNSSWKDISILDKRSQ